MSAPTVFLSAASLDLEEWRNILHDVLSDGGAHVLSQGNSFGMAPRDVRDLLVRRLDESDYVFHLAGIGYGSHATAPFPDAPGFQCSWTQFEYYYAHQKQLPVFAAVLAPDLSKSDFAEEGDADERGHKTELQRQHRLRVESGKFDGTPLVAGGIGRTCNGAVKNIPDLLRAVAGALREMRGLHAAAPNLAAVLDQRLRLHTLPPLRKGFVGRGTDLAKLRAANPANGTVLTGLRGMGGIGKTALSLVLAHEWAPRFPEAQLFLDARGTQSAPPSAGDLLAQVIQTFHPTAKLPENEAELRGIYADVLHGKRVLILLDNARGTAQAAPLIPPAGCALIVTSRQSVMLDTTSPHHVGRLPDEDAVALLREFHAALGDTDATELVRLCAGLPLALRIAGAHLALDAVDRGGTPDVTGYVSALSSGRLKHLDADAEDAGEITISETLRLSEDKLLPVEREAWRRLGIFTASFEAGAGTTISGTDKAMLDRFVRRSLLEREGEERYKLHDLAADYARAQLVGANLTALQLAHARHYVKKSQEAETLHKTKGKAVESLALFDRERTEIEAAFASLVARQDAVSATMLLDLVGAVGHNGALRFHPHQRIVWGEEQLAAARVTGNRQAEGTALANLGLAHSDLGDSRKAIEFHEKARAVSIEIGDRRGEGNALQGLGLAHKNLDAARRAIEFHEQALAIAREIPDRRLEVAALGKLGLAYADLDDPLRAIGFHEQVLAVSREIGDRRGEGRALGGLAAAYLALGDSSQAIEFCEQWLIITREINDERLEAAALRNLGDANADLGSARQAIGFYDQQLVIVRKIGNQRGIGNGLWNSALQFWKLGERAEAVSRATDALNIYEAIEDRNAAKVRTRLAEWRAG